MRVVDRIETERLVLRPFEERDWPGFFECMIDPRVTRFMLFNDEQKTEAGARRLFESVIQSYRTIEPIHSYSIVDKEDHFLGSCGFSPLPIDGIWECYYSLGVAYWNRGFAAEATWAILNHLFQTDGIREVRAYMHPENLRSEQLAERIGMRRMGFERHPVFRTDALVYAIDKGAFPQSVERWASAG